MKYRKKPIVIDAIQYTGDNHDEVIQFLFTGIEPEAKAFDGTIKTLEGDMKVQAGDWIIKGVRGEFYPVKNDIFSETYERVD